MFPVQTAIKALLSALPEKAEPFSGSEYPLPVHAAYLAEVPSDLNALSGRLSAFSGTDVKPLVDPILICAEAIESAQPDRGKYFIPDRKVQDYVFMGSKWRAGWALVLGGNGSEQLIEDLQDREFMVFTDVPGLPDTWDIGPRETSPVYFLQMMVRYGLTWGRIKPGDDHQLGHYLEKDMPGVVIIRKDLTPLKYLVTLGLMKLGAPALVPSTFPFPYGNRVVADTDREILERINGFENLRTRRYGDETISLPEYANTAYAHQEFPVAGRLGGPISFLCMRPAGTEERVSGDFRGRKDCHDIGILIEVREKDFSIDISAHMERAAYRALNFVDNWRARDSTEGFVIEWADTAPFSVEKAEEALRAGIRMQFPALEDFDISIIREKERLATLAPVIARFKRERTLTIDSMTEENTEQFCVCTECRPFSLVHTCIITPDRTPMCAARSYFSVKASAYFGSDQKPYKRRSETTVPLRHLFKRGKVIDLARGEYEGVNEVYRAMTAGALTRVRLHSLDEVPHTSCGCFQNLAFRIRGQGGIGIMKRGSSAVTPDGRTWEMLANYAGGKQSDGIMGVSNQYIASPNFLRGDGGLKSLVWADSEVYSWLRSQLPPNQRVATEDVKTVAELKAFLFSVDT